VTLQKGDPMGRERNARRGAAVVAGMLALSSVGCGGTMAFSDREPITIALAKAEPKPHRLVEITLDHIEIKERVLFEIDKAAIRPESFGLLDEVVAVLNENPRVKKVNVIGHTDDDGDESYNQQLSQRRAASVRTYLVDHGIAEARLESEGRGEADPLVSNDTSKGREKNRRVEFLILEQDTTKKVPEQVAAKEAQP